MERAITFKCQGETLIGILHEPEMCRETGVLIVVGGPQYRVGSHRQFVLLARHLAMHGIASFRFDHRGIGDSGGEPQTFENLSDDIATALNTFVTICPAARKVVIWGLCDAASAALIYAGEDPRVLGLVLLNPWVRVDMSPTETYLGAYYWHRLNDRQVWKSLFRDPARILESAQTATKYAVDRILSGIRPRRQNSNGGTEEPERLLFTERMLNGLIDFTGPINVVLSGDDLTAAAFRKLVNTDTRWKRAMRQRNVSQFEIESANHTFSSRYLRDQVSRKTVEWLIDG